MGQAAHLEQTIAAPLEFTGVGLHSGAPVTMRLLPAPAGSGIVFRRTDLDNFEIPATGRNVAKVSYATSLMRQGVLISTTEHLLSRADRHGRRQRDCGDRQPGAADSGRQRAALRGGVSRGGHRDAAAEARDDRVLRPVEVREGDKFIGVYPGSGYRISYTIDFPAPIGRQKTCVDLAAETYGTEIAPARTFGYKADEKKLRDMGLIRGAGPENAIILGRRGRRTGRCASPMNMCGTRCWT